VNAIRMYRLARRLYLWHVPIMPKAIYWLIFLLYNSSIPYTAEIGPGTKFGYGGMGVVIHDRARIGSGCIISQQVTIGGRSRHYEVPVIGDNCYLGAGAKILGPVVLGNHVVVGANAVVTHSVPDHCVVAGIPAKVIKQGILMEDYV